MTVSLWNAKFHDRELRLTWLTLAICGFLLSAITSRSVELEQLPLINPDVSAYQYSSHNKQGLNGDGGWVLHDGEFSRKGLAGWAAIDEGAAAAYTEEHVHGGKGALVHTVRLAGLASGWRSVRKQLSGGFNLEKCDRLSLYVWPTHADGGVDYAVRLDSGGKATQLDIRDLRTSQWNHVVLNVSQVERRGLEALWLLYHVSWGSVDNMQFYVDDIRFLQPDGTEFAIDDFESGIRRAVLFDAVGPGSVRCLWGLGEHDIRIEVDGQTIVDAPQEDFFQGRVPGFPLPLVSKALVASGPWQCVSHWSLVPIGFRQRCRITTDHPSPFYHVIAERYRDPAMAHTWSPAQDLEKLKALWSKPGSDPKNWAGLQEQKGEVEIPPGDARNLVDLQAGGAIAGLRLTLPETEKAPAALWLCMAWDGQKPAVEAPVNLFFGAGARWQEVPSTCFGIRSNTGYCYFPMPFWKSARIWLENRGTAPVADVGFAISWRREVYPADRAGHFRTTFHEGPTTIGRDWTFLEARGEGQFVGVAHRLIGGHYCEGDIRFYIDGSRSPAFYGTGTEDYYHQACWPNRDNHAPFHGCVGDVAEQAKQAGGGKTFYDFPASYYRVHLEAPVRFSSSIRCGIEHGGVNDTASQYASLAFWYGREQSGLGPAQPVSLPGGEKSTLRNFFEGDDDDIAMECEIGRFTKPTECKIAIDPANHGVRLRRVLDQAASPQEARVFVDGVEAGTWYDPDRNPWKRLAESDFELAPGFVRGKDTIQVRFEPQTNSWTAGELRVFSHVRP